MPQKPDSQASRRRGENRKRAKGKKKRAVIITLIALLCVIALLLIAGGVYLSVMLGRIGDLDDSDVSYLTSIVPEEMDPEFSGPVVDDPVNINDAVASVEEIAIQGNTKVITNILLVGVETDTNAREDVTNYAGRSDAMIILSIDKYHKTIKLASLLRDIYVAIPGHGHNKLNASFALGGFDLLSKTIEQNFRIRIDQFVAVNFKAFYTAIDAMDGVDIALSEKELNEVIRTANTTPTETSTAGVYHLDGTQALNYARIRKFGDDWGRTARQRTVLQALMKRAKTMDISTLNNVLYEVFPNVKTNMTDGEMAGYILNSPAYLGYTVSEFLVPDRGDCDGPYIKGVGQVLALKDPKASVLELHHFIYG